VLVGQHGAEPDQSGLHSVLGDDLAGRCRLRAEKAFMYAVHIGGPIGYLAWLVFYAPPDGWVEPVVSGILVVVGDPIGAFLALILVRTVRHLRGIPVKPLFGSSVPSSSAYLSGASDDPPRGKALATDAQKPRRAPRVRPETLHPRDDRSTM
jgi:hypothetical protein